MIAQRAGGGVEDARVRGCGVALTLQLLRLLHARCTRTARALHARCTRTACAHCTRAAFTHTACVHCSYFDNTSDDERLYFAVGPRGVLAFREDGTELGFGTDGENMIDIDAMRLRHVAESAEVMEVDEEAEAEVTVVTVELDTCPLRSLLASARLGEYYQVLVDKGYEDVAYLRSMSERHADEMAKNTRMKPGHLMRFHSIVRGVGD